MAGLEIDITGNDRAYLDALKRSRKATDDFLGGVETNGRRIEDMFASIGKKMGVVFGAYQLKNFASEIIKVRGEMQMLESSFEVLLGGKGVSGFISQLKQFAVDSPLSMTGVSNAAQTLLGFNIEAEKVIPTIKQLGDISMGNEQRFNSLTLAFAQMSSTGKLMGQDLLQMINAGFNPLSVISEQTGKSIGELKKEMEAGAISSEMVAEAFRSATAEGGKFYGMTQKQAEGLKGLQAQLEGAIQDALDEMGKSQEGVIASGYKMATTLVENYDKIGKAIISLIATYGAYKAAVVVNIVATQSLATSQFQLGVILARVRKMWQALTATMNANPYVLIATAIVALVATLWTLNDATSSQEAAQGKLNNIIDETKDKKAQLAGKANELITIINSETSSVRDQILAYKELQKEHKKYLGDKSFSDFKKLSEKEQQKLIEQSTSELDDKILEESLKKYEDFQKKLTDKSDGLKGVNEGVALLKEISKDLAIEGASPHFIRDTLQKTIDQLRAEKAARDQAGEEAASIKFVTYGEQVDKARKKITKLSDELTNLKKGVAPDNLKDGEQFDFAKGIESKAKELKEAEEKLSILLTGSSKKDSKKDTSEKDAEAYNNILSNRAKQALDLERKLKQEEINLMKDGSAKRIAQMKLNHTKEIDELRRNKEEYLKLLRDKAKAEFEADPKNKGKKFNSSGVGLSKAETDMFDNLEAQTLKRQGSEIAQERIKVLKDYQTYAQARLDAIKKYEDERKQLESLGASQEQLSENSRRKEKALEEIDNLFASKQESFNSWMQEISSLTLDQLTNALDQAKHALSMSQVSREGENSEKRNTEQVAILRAQITALESQIATLRVSEKKKDSKDGNKQAIKQWKLLQDVLDDTRRSFTDLGKAIGGTAGEILSSVGEISASSIQMINSIMALTNSAIAGVEGSSKAASAAIQTVEKASVILAIISAALQIATKIAEMFAADYSEYNKAKEAYEGYIAVLDKVIEKQKELVKTMTGENARRAYEEAIDLINNQTEATEKLARMRLGQGKSAGSHSLDYRMWKGSYKFDGQNWQDVARDVVKGLEDAGLGTVKFTGMYDMLDMTVEQLEWIRNNYMGLWGVMDDDFREYIESIIESEEQLAKLGKNLKESYTQVSFDEFKDSFLDTLSDMDSSSADFAENFEGYLKKAIINSLINKMYQKDIENLYDSYAKANEDDDITKEEYDDLQRQKDALVESMLKEREDLIEKYGWESLDDRSAEEKDITSMSQESGDKLIGLWTVSVEHTRQILDRMGLVNVSIGEMQKSYQGLLDTCNSILNHTRNIDNSTASMNTTMQGMNSSISNLREDINSMKINGIAIKK